MKKNTYMLVLFAIFLGTMFLFPTPVHATDVWFWIPPPKDEQNLQRLHFPRLFTNPEQWNKGLNLLDTFVFSIESRSGVWEDAFLKNKVLPLLNARHINIALDSGNATWLTCRKGQGLRNLQTELDSIKRFYEIGGSVSHIWMQSSLSKPVIQHLRPNCPSYNIDQRIADILQYMKAIHREYPNIKIGLIDNPTTHITRHNAGLGDSYQTIYVKLMDTLKANGETLDFILEDTSSELAEGTISPGIMEYPQILALENFVRRELNIKFGLILTSYDVSTSYETYAKRVIRQARTYKQIGGRPDFYLVSYPGAYSGPAANLLPEDDPVGYPPTKYLLAIERIVKNTALPSDLNEDGKVDIFDYNIFVTNFGKTGSAGWIKADIDRNGKVDIFDYNVLVGAFGK